MKIASANLQLASSHASLQQHTIKESLAMWVGQRRPGMAGENGQLPVADNVQLSDAGKAAQSQDVNEEDPLHGDARLTLIRSILELLTGRKIEIFDAAELSNESPPAANTANSPPPPPAAGYGIEYTRHESYTETEQTQFSASGTVRTADGREVNFSLELSMSRVYHEESDLSLRVGDAARKTDPLVLNFAGIAAQLTDQRFSFDLNADGRNEQINFVAPGSGFLVFDRNGDGKVNNGSELFGPRSNDGFAELAQLDDDQNGWIDENDAAFSRLQIWSRDAQGTEQLQSLSSASVGAIALSQISSPFALKNNANDTMGQIRSSGIFLQENGTAGTIQQIDLIA